jgi:hypothetical protein
MKVLRYLTTWIDLPTQKMEYFTRTHDKISLFLNLNFFPLFDYNRATVTYIMPLINNRQRNIVCDILLSGK